MPDIRYHKPGSQDKIGHVFGRVPLQSVGMQKMVIRSYVAAQSLSQLRSTPANIRQSSHPADK